MEEMRLWGLAGAKGISYLMALQWEDGNVAVAVVDKLVLHGRICNF